MSLVNHCTHSPQTIGPEATILDAARQMTESGVGCLVAVDARERPVGIVTDRDVVIRGLVPALALDEAPVSSIVSPLSAKAREVTSVERAITRMAAVGVRRLPVVDNHGRLTGVFAHDDALQLISDRLSLVAGAVAAQLPDTSPGHRATEGHSWEIPTARQYRTIPVTIAADATAFDAAHEMDEHGVGSVVVVGEGRQPVGIVTDRDLVRRVVAAGSDPLHVSVGDVMTKDIATVPEDASLRQVLEEAKAHGVRRLPLVDRHGELSGMVSLDDVIAELSSELAHLADAVRTEMRGLHYPALGRH